MIEAEKKQGADFATDALLWLKRCDFINSLEKYVKQNLI